MTFIFDEKTETCDDFLGGKLRFIQPMNGYRAGVEPVLLAAALPINIKGRVLDMGCGVGTAGLCSLWHNPNLHMVGIEANHLATEHAKRNAILNNMGERAEIYEQILGDEDFVDPLKSDEVDAVITNPPWFEKAHSQRAEGSRGAGRQEGEISLDIWLDYCIRKLRTGGLIAIIHRSHRMGDILQIFKGRIGNIKIIPIYSKQYQPAKHVIILGNKARKTPLELRAGFIMHDAKGNFLAEAKDIFMKGRRLSF